MLISLASNFNIEFDLKQSDNISIDCDTLYFSILHIPTGYLISLNSRPLVFYSMERAEKIKSLLCESNFVLGSLRKSFAVNSVSVTEFSPDRVSEFEVISISLTSINTESDNQYYFCK